MQSGKLCTLQSISHVKVTKATDTMELTEDAVDDILFASRRGDVDEVQKAIEASKTDVNEVLNKVQESNEARNSPLHYASANGHEKIIAYLLPLCTLPSLLAQNESGNTPLHWASFNGHLDVVKALVDRIESLVTATTAQSNGRSMLNGNKSDADTTAEEKDAELEKEAQKRSVWDVVNKAGRGPMSEAQMNNKEQVVDFLLARMVTAPAASAAVPNGEGEEEVEGQREATRATEVSQGEERGEKRPNAELSYEVEKLNVNDEATVRE